MKLVRFGPQGQEKPGVIDADGKLRDLSSVVADITPEEVRLSKLAGLKATDVSALPVVEGDVRYGVPVNKINKIIAVGLNYADHAAEAGLPVPPEPIFFTKAITSLTGPNDVVIKPRDATKLDWEVELGLIIGKTCRYVDEATALDHVAGYVLVNDISERAFQKERGTQWVKGKGADTFCPTGPWLVTPDEIGDVHNLDMFLDVNGVRRQTGNTKTLIFNVAHCISYISQFITLQPGDLVITGTPPGVGEGQKPTAIYLNAGDTMHLGITGLGEQRQTVVPFTLEGLEIIE
ncbi:fumarylacetoacetate hydrolase family protein [Asticcacaulis sp. BYS171W]|uniref:Fumarylacetoacetate hydrolase family protein n=1 Tax=Asticcacaulis aquaticus TaxID=2984212 RepID=A0ABT5HY61_9CAUL|nr:MULTISPECIES: fumarylacetoacetate hydrolase family protein [Asticcacaulis]ESQ78568.1 ureidoglycolate lyase [Asticcacaulis sp. YBE204]MDC7684963.1 fumarylacetoacetate hydrolase family protein [Asticcacaulis aquaticus]